MGKPVIHFEIPASDPKKLGDFYSGLFGWTINKMEGPMDYWMVTGSKDAGGIDGGIMPKQMDGQVPVNYVQVDSLEDSVQKSSDLGGATLVPPTDIPQVGRFAVVSDPEGNAIGLFQGG